MWFCFGCVESRTQNSLSQLTSRAQTIFSLGLYSLPLILCLMWHVYYHHVVLRLLWPWLYFKHHWGFFLACSEGLLADGGSQSDLPSVAEVGLWNSVGFGFLLSLWRNPRGSPWAQPSYRVRLKDHRHVQLVDIMARRGGRCFSTAVTGQLLPEGVQQLA